MAKFKTGDRVIIKCSASHPHLIGEITTICSEALRDLFGQVAYEVLLPPVTGVKFAQEGCLAPIDDGDDLPDWESVEKLTGWNPTKVAA